MIRRPDPTEFDASYSDYISAVPEGDLLKIMAAAPAEWQNLLAKLSATHSDFRYAPDKWSLSELLGHVIDGERLFCFRALHIARADPAPLPGMDQLVWAAASNAADRPLLDLIEEFRVTRAGHLALFGSFDEAALDRRGVASNFKISVRALAFIAAGHERHHRAVVAERYLPAIG